jgi:serine/threonine protein kinase
LLIANQGDGNMDQRAQRANLIINANIPGVGGGSSRRVLQYLNRQNRDQYLWLYREGFKTIYGKFYKSLPIELNDEGDQFHGHREPGYFEREQFAVKSVSIQQYIENVNNMEEDPYNEIKISDHIFRNMNANQIVNNGIIITRGILSNRSQENISNDEKYYFIISQLANGGDLFERIMEEGEDNMDTIRNLFRQMVSSIQCLHNEAHVFHRDLSLENFVINNNGDDNKRIFVIDFGQAQIIEDGAEQVRSTGYFGKVSTI